MKSIQFLLCIMSLIAAISCQPVTEDETELFLSPTAILPTEPPTPQNSNLDHLTQLAIADLAQRLELDPNLVHVIEAQEVTWMDASLGCSQPGMMYAQVQTAGYLIKLEANSWIYEYHTDTNQQVVICEENVMMPIKNPGDIKDGEPWMR